MIGVAFGLFGVGMSQGWHIYWNFCCQCCMLEWQFSDSSPSVLFYQMTPSSSIQ